MQMCDVEDCSIVPWAFWCQEIAPFRLTLGTDGRKPRIDPVLVLIMWQQAASSSPITWAPKEVNMVHRGEKNTFFEK